MTLMLFELKRNRLSLAVWTAAIALLLLVCLAIFPDMKGQVNELNAAFSSMGSFTEAFGMDQLNFGELMGFYGLECGNILGQLNFGELMGFYGLECGNILGIGGAFFAAYIGVNALAGEEKNRTAEYLLTHPVSRSRVVFEKLACVLCQILILNAVSMLTSLIAVRAIGESLQMKEFLLLHAAYLLLQAEIAAVCFAISAVLRKSGIGAGLGLAAILYFLNIIANLTEDAKWLKYITPFGYAEAADIITESSIDPAMAAVGACVTIAGIAAAFFIYERKDIY